MSQFPVIILAGGLGTRLMPMIANKPKLLAQVAGKPFIEWKFEELRRGGISNVLLLLGHLGVEVFQYCENKPALLNLAFMTDGINPLGTGKAVYKALQLLDSSHVLLTYGDNLLDLQISSFSATPLAEEQTLMILTAQPGVGDKLNSRLETTGEVSKYEKNSSDPSLNTMDYGYLLLSRTSFLHHYNESDSDLSTVISKLCNSGLVIGKLTDKNYYEIGTPESLLVTEQHLLEQRNI